MLSGLDLKKVVNDPRKIKMVTANYPGHEIFVLIAYSLKPPIKAHAEISREAILSSHHNCVKGSERSGYSTQLCMCV